MTKFDSPHESLEVVSLARFNPGYLNRQIVLLLRTLGVDEQVCRRCIVVRYMPMLPCWVP